MGCVRRSCERAFRLATSHSAERRCAAVQPALLCGVITVWAGCMQHATDTMHLSPVLLCRVDPHSTAQLGRERQPRPQRAHVRRRRQRVAAARAEGGSSGTQRWARLARLLKEVAHRAARHFDSWARFVVARIQIPLPVPPYPYPYLLTPTSYLLTTSSHALNSASSHPCACFLLVTSTCLRST